MRELPIVYGLNDNYWFQTLVSSVSALRLATDCRLVFHYLVEGVTAEHRSVIASRLNTSRSCVIFHDVDNSIFKGLPSWRGTMMTWSRCAIYKTIPELSGWTCFCDGDTLWFKDPQLVFDIADKSPDDLIVYGSWSNKPTDTGKIERLEAQGIELTYDECFCMGFVLMRVDKLRQMDFLEKTKEYVAKYGPPQYLEQDIFNVVLKKQKQLLPMGWGVYSQNGNLSRLVAGDVGVVHYVQDFPWTQSWRNGLTDVKKEWWKVAEEAGLQRLDKQFAKRPLVFALMCLLAKIRPILPSAVRKRMSGEFIPLKF